MKTHDLADILEYFAKVLRGLPNIDFGEIVSTPYQEVSSKSQNVVSPQVSQGYLDEITGLLGSIPPDKINNFFSDDDQWKSLTNKQIFMVAKKVGINVSARQSRASLENQLMRSLEANKIDDIMRAAKQIKKNEHSTDLK